MGVYIGVFDIVEGFKAFYNFKPLAEVTDQGIVSLDYEARGKLLPDSVKRDIYFDFKESQSETINSVIYNGRLMVFEFETSDLQPSLNSSGERNPTGYKVQAFDMIESKKLRPLTSIGAYILIHSDEIASDFPNDSIIELSSNSITDGDEILLETSENMGGLFAGPYLARYRNYTDSYIVKPLIKEQKHIIKGYEANNLKKYEIKESARYFGDKSVQWEICFPVNASLYAYKDVMSSEQLLDSFVSNIGNVGKNSDKIEISDIPALIKAYEESELSGEGIPESIRKSRIEKLISILSTESSILQVMEQERGIVLDFIVASANEPKVKEWLTQTLEHYPEIFEGLRDTKTVRDKIQKLDEEYNDLQSQIKELELQIQEQNKTIEERNKVAIGEKSVELKALEQKYTETESKLSDAQTRLGILGEAEELSKKLEGLRKDEEYYQKHTTRLEEASRTLEMGFQEIINKSHEKMVGLSFDGYMASKLLNAASTWESEEEEKHHQDFLTKINSIEIKNKNTEELVHYLCQIINTVRPTYSRNDILNIAICITQGFLTVFSGEPGCGKTSICNIFGDVLGLNKIVDIAGLDDTTKNIAKRYLPVSVERGWTSKRDFVGYYNPLSKTFDKSNRRVYEALYQLSNEKKKGVKKFPYIILLDEANLSPMEYYWSDFMNICDDLNIHSEINLGEDYIFGVPETLHFCATINNDHTTETLSPRLIDRAWVITMIGQSTDGESRTLNNSEIELIGWSDLAEAFLPNSDDLKRFSEIGKTYSSIVSKMKEQRFYISPRNNKAIKKYWAVASKVFEADDTQTDASIVALDFAVAQKLLPKIIGNGEDFRKWLEEFRSLCSNMELNKSASILQDIIARGDQNMKYYQFFF